MLKLAPIFSDHAVLQREHPIIVYGEAQGHLRIEFLGETQETNADGAFSLTLSAHPAGGPYDMSISVGAETQVLHDLYIGDVVLLSGQSNMQFKAREGLDLPAHTAPDPLARVFHAPRPESKDAFDDQWQGLTDENAGNWSAIGYFLAPLLRRATGVAIGMVCAYQGAAVIQSFLSPENAARFTFPKEQRHPDHDSPLFSRWNPPSRIYETMLRAIFPYQVSHVVWYQGESNTSMAEGACYDAMLTTLIDEWRGFYHNDALPFTVIQINDFETPFNADGWALVQKAQEKVAATVPGVSLVTIRDLGEHALIHPLNKKSVAERVFKTF